MAIRDKKRAKQLRRGIWDRSTKPSVQEPNYPVQAANYPIHTLKRRTRNFKTTKEKLLQNDERETSSKRRKRNFFKTTNHKLQNDEPETSKRRTRNFKTTNRKLQNDEPETSKRRTG
jgi:hypothetical protein